MTRIVTQVAANTADAAQVITLPAGLVNDPKAFQFWLVPGTVNGTPVAHAIIGYGVAAVTTTGYTQRSISVRSRDAVNPSNTRRMTEDGACICLLATGSSTQAQASITDSDATSVTLNWSILPPSGYLLIVEAIDCAEAAVGQFDIPQSLDDLETVTVGFEFSLIYIATHGRAIPDDRSGVYFSWGVATWDGTTLTQLGYSRAAAYAVTPTQVAAYLSTDYISPMTNYPTGALAQAFSIGNVTATTFDATNVFVTSDYSNEADAFYLALRFAEDVPISIGTAILPGAPDASFDIDVGLTASSVELLATTLSVIDAGKGDGEAGSFGWGIWDGTREYSAAVADEDNSATSDAESVAGANIIRIRQHDGTTGVVATVDSVSGDNFIINISSALARYVAWVAIGAPVSGSVTADFSGTPLTGTAPLSVTFTDASTDEVTTITEWLWDFGDGSTSTEQNPVHEYASAATYTVSLTVSDGTLEHTLTETDYITVSDPAADPPDLTGLVVLGSVAVPALPYNDVLVSVQVEA